MQRSSIRDSLAIVKDITQLIRNSPKRTLIFEQVKEELRKELPSFRPLCPTRWTVRTEALNSVLKNYAVLLEAFEEIAQSCRDEQGAKASGIVSKLQEFATFFGLNLSFALFSVSEQFSRMLQDKQTSIDSAVTQGNIVHEHFLSLRNDSEFEKFFNFF